MKQIFFMLSVTFLLGGCGEFAYKQGASAQDLALTKKACQAESATEINKCLEEYGWQVQQLDDLDLFATASVTPNGPQGSASAHEKVVDDAPEEMTSKTTAKNQQSIADGKRNPLEASKKEKSPLDIYVVSSWWKMGAGREPLEKDTQDCVATLGEAHQPNPTTHQVTRGLVVCLHEKGWMALKAK